MVQLIADFDLHMRSSPMCAFGMLIRDSNGEQELAKKMTTWLSNGEAIVDALHRRCSGDHPHADLFGGKAKQAQVYPPELCKAIIQGLKAQIKLASGTGFSERERTETGCRLTCGPGLGVGPVEVPVYRMEIERTEEEDLTQHGGKVYLSVAENGTCEYHDHHEDDPEDLEATDDVHGGALPAELV